MKKLAIVLATVLLMSSGAQAQEAATAASPNDGAAGAIGATVSSSGTYRATGGDGGAGKNGTTPTNAGNGGGGGVGISVSGTPTVTTQGAVGGNGGVGGQGTPTSSATIAPGKGGVGGAGAAGMAVKSTGVTNITNVGGSTIKGGNGGGGGWGGNNDAPSVGYFGGAGGNGGAGGAGIQVLTGTANITNNGTIQGGAGGQGGLPGYVKNHGNAGDYGSNGSDASGIRVFSGATASITNRGTINGGGNAPDILNQGTISILSNAQGTNGYRSNPLTYSGKLPSNYNIIISLAGYGQLSASNVTGSMTFGVASGSVITKGTTGFGDVLQGFSSSNIKNFTGTFNGLTWKLTQAGTVGNYDLKFPTNTPGSPAASPASTTSAGVTTTVTSGNNLTVTDPKALGTGTVALIGTATVPATITTTSNMTIGNNITVANDPVFNVAKGTTATVTGQITDASTPAAPGATVTGIPGDVVAAGGGTLNLQAVNTYTGLTTVDAGSTLALTGAGSIANSYKVINNGKFDITGVAPTVSVHNYTQTSTGNLAMNNGQQLNVTGTASLAGGLALSGTSSLGKTPLITTTNGVTGKFNSITANTPSAINVIYTPSEVDLITYSFNTADVQQSLANNVSALQNVYTLQNTVVANSFSYDCNEFGVNNVCVSAGGRYTGVSANGVDNTSALLIGAYRVSDSVRIGGYLDRNLTQASGNPVNLSNGTPLVGVFGAWNQRTDGTGTEVKVSAATGNKDATVTRGVVNGTEPGTGSSTLTSRGAQVIAKYGFAVTEKTIVAPYAGVRYTQNNMGGYTENTSTNVTAPLTYSALNTNATTALAGVGATHKVTEKLGVYGSAGVESDTHAASGTYTASGLVGLTSINFNANPVKTRPTATLGTYYNVAKNQRIALTGIYRQEAFQGVSTKTALATYTVGF